MKKNLSNQTSRMFCLAILLLIITNMTIVSVSAQPAEIALEPPTLEVGPPVPTTFLINVTVADVTDLFNWQVVVIYDNSILNCTDAFLPSDNVFAGENKIPVEPVINHEEGWLLYGCSLLFGAETFSGSGILCQLNFTGLANGVSDLHLVTETGGITKTRISKLEDSVGTPIEFTTSDGTVTVIPEFPALLIGPLLVITTLLAMVLKSKLGTKTTEHS